MTCHFDLNNQSDFLKFVYRIASATLFALAFKVLTERRFQSVLPDWFIRIPVLPVRTESRSHTVHQSSNLDSISPVRGEVVDGDTRDLVLKQPIRD